MKLDRLRNFAERLRDLAAGAAEVRNRGRAWLENYSVSFAAAGALLGGLLSVPALVWNLWGAGALALVGGAAGFFVGRRREQ